MTYIGDAEKVDVATVEEISATQVDSTPVGDDLDKLDFENVEEISATQVDSTPVGDDLDKLDFENVEEISAAQVDSTPVEDAEKVDAVTVDEISAAQVDSTSVDDLNKLDFENVKGFQVIVPNLGTSSNTFNRKIAGGSSESRVLGNASAPKQEKVFVTTREISEDEVPPEIREVIRRKEEQRAQATKKSPDIGVVANFVNAGANSRFTASVKASTEKQVIEQSDEELQRQREERARVKAKILVDKILKRQP